MKKETGNSSKEDIEQAVIVIKMLAKWQFEADELRRSRILLMRILAKRPEIS
jgi:hypothetical protein